MVEDKQGEASVLEKFFAHNAWANLKLLNFCEALSDEQLDAIVVGGFGSIRQTLRHTISAEIGYVDRMNGKLPPRPWTRSEFPGFAVLKESATWASEELLLLGISARNDPTVQEFPMELTIEYKLASLIVQAITHSTEHRTQIATIITQLGMEPPDLSLWYYIEETGEYRSISRTG